MTERGKMNTKDAIEKLKQKGLTARVKHERPILVMMGSRRKPADIGFGTRHELEQMRSTTPGIRFGLKGGATTVTIVSDDTGDIVAIGHAFCRPDDEKGPGDQFNRKLGTRIALGRALKELEATQ